MCYEQQKKCRFFPVCPHQPPIPPMWPNMIQMGPFWPKWENPFWSRTHFPIKVPLPHRQTQRVECTSSPPFFSDSAMSGIMMMHQSLRVWWLSRGRWWSASATASGVAPGRLASASAPPSPPQPSSALLRSPELHFSARNCRPADGTGLACMQASHSLHSWSASACVLRPIKQFSIWLSIGYFLQRPCKLHISAIATHICYALL